MSHIVLLLFSHHKTNPTDSHHLSQILSVCLQMRHRMDMEAIREGENVPKLDQVDMEATRQGEALPKLDQEDQEDIEATREGETLPKLDQVDQEDIEATREGETVPKLEDPAEMIGLFTNRLFQTDGSLR